MCFDRPRAMCSVAGHVSPVVRCSSTSGFHRWFATKPVCSETSKAEPRSVGDHSSIRDSWPIAFSGYPTGPRVGWEDSGARSTERLPYQLSIALEPECLENPTATAREDPRGGADWLKRHSSRDACSGMPETPKGNCVFF